MRFPFFKSIWSSDSVQGEVYTLMLSILEAHFPIFALFTVAALGALHAFFYSLLVATVCLIIWFGWRGKHQELKRTKAYKSLALTSIVMTSMFILLFLALQTTSPSHVALILFLQVLFGYLLFGRHPGERLEATHLIGVLLMTGGAVIVLFPKDYAPVLGDGLVLLAAAMAPLGQFFQKQARAYVSSETILMTRSLIALPFIYILAIRFEPSPSWSALQAQWLWILLTGVLVFFVAKVLWIEALHRLPITKVNALFAFSPLLTLVLAYFYLNEMPTWSQILGGLPIIIGSYFITQKPKSAA